jgi:CRISPR-associated protein Cmr2
LLVADGDNMGRAIDRLTSQQSHRDLSLVLSQFAFKVEKIVSKYSGILIYAGGDDVMAFLPLHTVLQCANTLAEEFAQAMTTFRIDQYNSPTLSTGIVIAHHLESLSDTLNLARQAEKAAKTVVGKHGLAITLSKRSGADRTIKGRRVTLASRLAKMIDWQRKGTISAGVAYEMQELQRVLGPSVEMNSALIAESLRIVERKRESGGERPIDSNEVGKYLEQWIKSEKVDLYELSQELIVSSLFADAMNMAEGPLTKEIIV